MPSVFPHLEISAAMSSSPIWSTHCFSYADISSYTLSHFCLSITSYVEKEHP